MKSHFESCLLFKLSRIDIYMLTIYMKSVTRKTKTQTFMSDINMRRKKNKKQCKGQNQCCHSRTALSFPPLPTRFPSGLQSTA